MIIAMGKAYYGDLHNDVMTIGGLLRPVTGEAGWGVTEKKGRFFQSATAVNLQSPRATTSASYDVLT